MCLFLPLIQHPSTTAPPYDKHPWAFSSLSQETRCPLTFIISRPPIALRRADQCDCMAKVGALSLLTVWPCAPLYTELH